MSLPMNLDFKGGSSEAKSTTTTGALDAGGGGGTRAPVFNTATGRSSLSATTGSGVDGQTIALAAAALVGALFLWKRGHK